MRHVVIIGGGITGLATAYYLQEAARAAGISQRTTLVERGPNLGGKIVTERADGFVVEGGPDSFISQKPWAADLCRQLGLESELIGTNDARRKTFVCSRGQLNPLPDGMMLIVPTRILPFATSRLISWPGKLRMGMELLVPRRRDGADETVGDFVRRRLGREALDRLAGPLLSGIHMADPDNQSLLATFPRFRDLETKHGSLIRGMLAQRRDAERAANASRPLFTTLRGGMGQLVRALEQALADGQIMTGASVVAVERRDGAGDGYDIRLADGRAIEADAVVLATPAYVAADLIARLAPALSAELKRIRYVSTATISLGFHRADLTRPLDGFGYVTARGEGRPVFACTWTSTKFSHRAPEGSVLLRCFVGGHGREELLANDDQEIIALAGRELAATIGLRAQPRLAKVFRWPRGTPQYDLGHLDRIRAIRAECEPYSGLFVAGSAYDGIGVPDCVRQGQQAAQHVLAYLNR